MSIEWGATIDGGPAAGDAPWDIATWERFERHAGKHTGIVHWGQPWGRVDLDALNLAGNRYVLSLVDYELPDGVTLADVAAGRQDAAIDAMAKGYAEFGQRVLIRPWYEFNGDWSSWSRSPHFVDAWKHLTTRLKAKAPGVRMVWCPNVVYGPGTSPALYWPGGKFVDYTGMDGYNWGTNPIQPDRWLSPQELFQPTLKLLGEIAPGHKVIICETACTEHGGSKADWIRRLLSIYIPTHPSIAGVVWFNNASSTAPAGMDWPIESSPASQAAFKRGIALPYYRASE